MRVNTKIRYALRAMYEIASNKDENGILQKEIAKSQNLSLKYLDHIISALKARGLINNKKGKRSGLILRHDPKDITIYDIYRAFETDMAIVECLNEPVGCDLIENCPTYDFWKKLNNQIIETLKSETLYDILTRQNLTDKSNPLSP